MLKRLKLIKKYKVKYVNQKLEFMKFMKGLDKKTKFVYLSRKLIIIES